MARLANKLPGVYVETAELPPADELPRMDIAGFVGFAASGPLSLPVPFDDLGRFRDVFGPDIPLARDAERGEVQTSLLGPAVEAFFANGGRRAWVVRVADASKIVTLSFPLPGLEDQTGTRVSLPARSPGRWPLGLAADTRLIRGRLQTDALGLATTASGWNLALIPSPEPLVPGDLLELSFRTAGLVALALVDGVDTLAGRTMAHGEHIFWRRRPAGDGGSLGVENTRLTALSNVLGAASAGLPAEPDLVHRLSFEIALWRGQRIESRLSGLGFSAAHPRYWGLLPDDMTLFAPQRGRARPSRSAAEARLIAEATAPRFPLAAPKAVPALTLPWGMLTSTGRERAESLAPPDGPPIALDGLATFDERLFLDPDLVHTPAGALLGTMEAKHANSLAPSGVAPDKPLQGLHSLLTVQEVSMVAVPDAVHRRWSPDLPTAPSPAPPLTAPQLDVPATEPDEHGRIALDWNAVPGAERYRIETAADGSFFAATAALSDTDSGNFPIPEGCPATFVFRVRAERTGGIGPWSNTRIALVPDEDFRACETPRPLADLTIEVQYVGSPPMPILVWQREAPAVADPDDSFEVQVGIAPTMDGASAVFLEDPTATSYEPPPQTDGTRYYRVRLRRADQVGPWSRTVFVEPVVRGEWMLVPEAEHDGETLTAVHRALIRFCAARADLFALLSLPRHFREPEVIAHLATLLPQASPNEAGPRPTGVLKVPPIRFGEDGALSYSALYHPWIATVSNLSNGVFQAPDGAAAGLLAHRTLAEGAWTAAANTPVAGAVAVSPQLDHDAVARLIALNVNPAMRDPRGILFFNAETLSLTDEFRPLPVRRLMILLRRLAIREGTADIFEPNSDNFRALVHRRFERLLSIIHQRGGFAGSTPNASFNVVSDESVNTRQSIELGRFVVELRVAPSRPFHFLNIRLLHTGPQQLQVREG